MKKILLVPIMLVIGCSGDYQTTYESHYVPEPDSGNLPNDKHDSDIMPQHDADEVTETSDNDSNSLIDDAGADAKETSLNDQVAEENHISNETDSGLLECEDLPADYQCGILADGKIIEGEVFNCTDDGFCSKTCFFPNYKICSDGKTYGYDVIWDIRIYHP